jgi:hypothetical protein
VENIAVVQLTFIVNRKYAHALQWERKKLSFQETQSKFLLVQLQRVTETRQALSRPQHALRTGAPPARSLSQAT